MAVTIEISNEQFETILTQASVEQAKTGLIILRKIIDKDTLDNYDIPIKDLGLSPRVLKVLELAKITRLKEILSYEIEDIMKFRNMGEKGVDELRDKVFNVYGKKD